MSLKAIARNLAFEADELVGNGKRSHVGHSRRKGLGRPSVPLTCWPENMEPVGVPYAWSVTCLRSGLRPRFFGIPAKMALGDHDEDNVFSALCL